MAGAHILVVEDEPKLSALLADYLRAAGFVAEIIANGRAAVAAVQASEPALVLLDLMLPGMDGTDVCRALRRMGEVPIIMLTARIEEVDRLLGLELGADDYICKPFPPREVVARVKSVLRRSATGRTEAPASGLAIDADRFEARVGDQVLDLTPVEFRLLQALAAGAGRVFSRDQLLDRLYTDHRIVTDRTVDSHVKNLRRKLEAALPGAQPIRSIYGVGYKLEL